jgi:hypothetical protein
LEKQKKNKRGSYLKHSKRTQKHCKLLCNKLASKGFLPVDEYMSLKGIPIRNDKLTPEPDKIAAREESKEDFDEMNALEQACISISRASEEESEGCLSGKLHNARSRLTHNARMESKESSPDDDKETCTTSNLKHLEDIRRKAVEADQMVSQSMPGFIFKLLGDRSKLREAIIQLTRNAKTGNLDVIVWARFAAMIGLLNVYTDDNLKYSWRRASEIVAKTEGRGENHVQRICEWVINFLRWRDLPFHQLNRKRGTILDNEDIAGEIKTKMMEKTRGGFLKAQDVVEVVASPEMQAIFTQKGISKATISIKTVFR